MKHRKLYLWHILHSLVEQLLRIINLLGLTHHFLVEILFVASVASSFHDALGQQLDIAKFKYQKLKCVYFRSVSTKAHLLDSFTVRIQCGSLLQDRNGCISVAHRFKDLISIYRTLQNNRDFLHFRYTYFSLPEQSLDVFWLASQHLIHRLQCRVVGGHFHLRGSQIIVDFDTVLQ